MAHFEIPLDIPDVRILTTEITREGDVTAIPGESSFNTPLYGDDFDGSFFVQKQTSAPSAAYKLDFGHF